MPAADRRDSQPSFGGSSRLARRAQAASVTAGETKPEPKRIKPRHAASSLALTEETIREIDQTTG